ncbi:DAK1 DegV-like protein [Chiua virens]|nr:DAK1 DegV-like protein [Chiua virens]
MMSNKHIFDSAEGLVLTSLRGTVAQNPGLRLHASTKTVYQSRPSADIVVISGGGAGHEPAHAGYVGHGMLASMVSGDIFASPSAKQILAAIEFAAFVDLEKTTDGVVKGRDVVIVLNNYTGDRLNFGLAIEQARARYPGLNITSVLNADDVSLLPQTRGNEAEESMVGPRGLGGNIFVCKILGAYATFGANGASTHDTYPKPTLERTKLLGDALVAHLRSIGATLGHCHVPGRQPHSASELIPDGQIELGLGLHNEPGVRRVPLASPESLITEMVNVIRGSGGGWKGSEIHIERILRHQAHETWIREGDEIALFINNLGGMSVLEMGAIVEQPHLGLYQHGYTSASYMTSLNAPGFSISLINVTRIEGIVNANSPADPISLLALLDAPTEALSWVGVRSWPVKSVSDNRDAESEAANSLESIRTSFRSDGLGISSSTGENHLAGGYTWTDLGFSAEEVKKGIQGACQSVFASEPDMTRFDTIVGDGDCGHTFVSGAKSILEALDQGSLEPLLLNPASFVSRVGEILEGTMGGTIGALFAIFFTAWSTALRNDLSLPSGSHSPLKEALVALGKHTPARPGDRTVVDALAPLCESVTPTTSSTQDLREMVKAVKKGAESTRGMKAKLGRASYVMTDDEHVPPDPGAWGVAAVVEGFVGSLQPPAL